MLEHLLREGCEWVDLEGATLATTCYEKFTGSIDAVLATPPDY